jgi:hypothetical protein
MFFVYFCKPVYVVEGISLKLSCFDGAVRNVRVGCDWFSSKNVSILMYIPLHIIFAWVLTLWK